MRALRARFGKARHRRALCLRALGVEALEDREATAEILDAEHVGVTCEERRRRRPRAVDVVRAQLLRRRVVTRAIGGREIGERRRQILLRRRRRPARRVRHLEAQADRGGQHSVRFVDDVARLLRPIDRRGHTPASRAGERETCGRRRSRRWSRRWRAPTRASPPAPRVAARDRDPSRLDRGHSRRHRDPSRRRRDPSRPGRDPSRPRRDPSRLDREHSRLDRHRDSADRRVTGSAAPAAARGAFVWSGTRDSNSRHPAWEAGTLPTELVPPARPNVYPCRGAPVKRCRVPWLPPVPGSKRPVLLGHGHGHVREPESASGSPWFGPGRNHGQK